MHNPDAAGQSRQTLDVLVVGEALTDIVTSPEGSVEHPGGSRTNVAYGLGRCMITYDPNIRPALLGSHARQRPASKTWFNLTDAVNSAMRTPCDRTPGRTCRTPQSAFWS